MTMMRGSISLSKVIFNFKNNYLTSLISGYVVLRSCGMHFLFILFPIDIIYNPSNEVWNLFFWAGRVETINLCQPKSHPLLLWTLSYLTSGGLSYKMCYHEENFMICKKNFLFNCQGLGVLYMSPQCLFVNVIIWYS